MDLLYGLAFDLLLKLFLDKHAVLDTGPPPTKPGPTMRAETPRAANIPEWVTSIPKNGFVGISRPCESIAEARQYALNSAVSQILQAMGAEYSLKHTSTLAGDVKCIHHELDERLIYTAKWFIRSVQQNIKKSDIKQIKDKYICFILIDFPPAKIEWLRKMAVGPKVSARIVEKSGDRLIIDVRENNGVPVTLTDYHIEIRTKNRHAGIITMFAWKVPKSSIRNFEGGIERKISIQGNSQIINIPYPTSDTNLKSIVFGAEIQIKVVLLGYDEMARDLSIKVKDL